MLKTEYAYNPSDYFTKYHSLDFQGATIHSFAYIHNVMGNRTSMTDLAGVPNYSYDTIYQLIRATHPLMPAGKI